MLCWILKVRGKNEYEYGVTFSTEAEALAYIERTGRTYYIPVKAVINVVA